MLTICVITSKQCGSASAILYHTILHQVSLIAQPMVPSVVSVYIVEYNIFHRPDEAMLFVMVKACLCLKHNLFIQNLEGLYSSNRRSFLSFFF